ncbi:ACH96228.1 unknown protein [Kallithea virus]|uniref:Uncharacterized protein n=1 Tax=Kallithea virus TaxID=1654582 RepID=A0A1S5VG38_9VIRU|nr:ACH96228.1 unknown protein [Kallithea virus]AQN78614.1 ACH96228.1 unknown protein [Kallithea virus]
MSNVLNTNINTDILDVSMATLPSSSSSPQQQQQHLPILTNVQSSSFGQPHFLTNKLCIQNISQRKNVYDYQLRDHFLNIETLRQLNCSCPNHKHNKLPCTIVTGPICTKCKTPTSEVISFQSTLFHPELTSKNLLSCCTHIHTPPCRRCINCQTSLPCVVTEPFECSVSTGLYIYNRKKH